MKAAYRHVIGFIFNFSCSIAFGASSDQVSKAYAALPSNLTVKFGTQCGDRAHVWSYILKKKFDIDSRKIFLYYTPKSYNYTGMLWGFHVATLVEVDGADYVVEKIPKYTVTDRGYVLDLTRLTFEAPVPLKDWLKAETGFDSCKELDMHNPLDRNDFEAFNSKGVYQSPENCIIAKTPSAYWWPDSVLKAVRNNDFAVPPTVDPGQALSACMNTYPEKNKNQKKSLCEQLLDETGQ